MKVFRFSGDIPVQLGNGNSFYLPGFIQNPEADFALFREELKYHRVSARGNHLHRQKIAMVVFNEDGSYPFYRYRFKFDAVEPIHPRVLTYIDLIKAELRKRGLPEHKINHVISTLYLDGRGNIGLHSDNPQDIMPVSLIWDISLGAARVFRLVSNDGKYCQEIMLQPGSLLVLDAETNATWKHEVPPMKPADSVGPRISFVFRAIGTMLQPATGVITQEPALAELHKQAQEKKRLAKKHAKEVAKKRRVILDDD